jgi:signal peptidase I
MSSSGLQSEARRKRPARPRSSGVRQTVELIVVLCVSVLVVKTFSAEAYVVPTGSMAPTLLGWHRELSCPSCHAVFVVGIEDEGQTSAAICPNCGKRNLDDTPSIECGGDRVLVEKFLYEFRRPRRWEVAVFHFPGEPSQAYVKRVVGLPGELIRIKDGDVFVNDRLARKSLAEIRAMRVLVHDSRFQPQDAAHFPRWLFRSDAADGGPADSAWSRQGTRFVHSALSAPGSASDDWLVYKHWDAGRGGYGRVTDFHGYNGSEPRQLNEINDLGIEARVTLGRSIESLSVVLRSGFDRFLLRIPTRAAGEIELLRNGRAVPVSRSSNPFLEKNVWPRTVVLEAAVMDRRFQAAIDGKLLFEPFDFDDPVSIGALSARPVALGVRGGEAEVSEIQVYRDIYYTGMLANTPRQPHGLRSGVKLGADEFFVLGDNSSVSNDSRFWSEGPVVRGSMFVGKPFLVHLPGELVPLKVFGRSFCWVPDPRRIRYIR